MRLVLLMRSQGRDRELLDRERFEVEFARYVESVSVRPGIEEHNEFARFYGANNATLGWPAQPIADLVARVRERFPRVSERTVRALLRRAVVELVDENLVSEDADPEIEVDVASLLALLPADVVGEKALSLFDSMDRHIKDYHVFVPFAGIELGVPKLDIASGTLYPRDSEEFKIHLEKTRFDEQHRQFIVEQFARYPALYASRQIGDTVVAVELAREEAQAAIHLLRFFLTASKPGHQAKFRQIRLCGEPETEAQHAILVAAKGEDPKWRDAHHSSQMDTVRIVKVTSQLVSAMSDEGLNRLETALLGGTGELDSRLKRALQWFSYAVASYVVEQRFVGFAIALEVLLAQSTSSDPWQSWGGIAQTLGERSAFLLAEEWDERRQIAADVKKLYGKRSAAVHSGKTIAPGDLERMHTLARRVILAFVQKDFRSWEQFTEWVERCKYAGGQTAFAEQAVHVRE